MSTTTVRPLRPRPAMGALLALLVSLPAASAFAAPTRLAVAAVQYPIEGNKDAAAIVEKVSRFVAEARRGGADVVVLPELLTLDAWPLGDKRGDAEVTREIAREVTAKYFAAVKRLAREHHVHIVGGSSPRLVGDRVLNTAIVAFADGRTLYQDKLQLTPWEVESGWSAGEELRPFDAPWGRSVVLICYDAEFPTLSAALMDAKPLVWFVPSMTDTRHGLERVRWSAQARAVEHHAFVVVTGTVGSPSLSFPNVGQAVLVTPRGEAFSGEVVVGALNEPGIVRGVLDLDRLRESRAKAGLYPAKDALARKSAPRVIVTTPR